MKNKLKTIWTQGFDKGKQESFTSAFFNSPVPERLKEILNKRLQEAQKTSEADYESPSWAYKQADQNGYTRALEYVLNLITTE